MFDPKLAIEWLNAKQKLCLKMELPLTELIVELYEYVDQFSEHDLPGLADFLALYAELLESLPEEHIKQVDPVIHRLAEQLNGVFDGNPSIVAQGLVSCLRDVAWAEPLPEEDSGFLLELLELDCRQLNSVDELDHSERADAELLDTPIPPSVDLDLDMTPDQTVEQPSSESSLAPSPVVESAFPGLFALLTDMAAALPYFSEEHTEKFYEQIDIHSEHDWSGFSDLLALYGELLAQLSDTDSAPCATALNQAILGLLSQPTADMIAPILALMTDQDWPEPVASEDTEFLSELLEQDLERLNSGTFVANEMDEGESVEPLALIKEVIEPLESQNLDGGVESDLPLEASQPLPEPPSFCSIDFTLLQEEGPKIEPAVIDMLSQSVTGLAEQWQENSLNSKLLDESRDLLATVIRALDTINLIGAKVLVEGLILNLDYLIENTIPLTVESSESIHACLTGLQEYFVDISVYERQQTLLDQYVDTQLPCRPTVEQAFFYHGAFSFSLIAK